MAKSGRSLWTKKISGASVPAGGGKWSIEDLRRASAGDKKVISTRPSAEERYALPERAESDEIKRLERNARLREKYQQAKSQKARAALEGRRIVGRVLGIDPSLRGTGLAVIEARSDGSLRYVESKTVKNSPAMSMPECLARIYAEASAMIARTLPTQVAIEQCVYVQNFRTALILGSSRGAALAAVAGAKLEVFEYPPLRIKQAVVGFGRASKEQVARSIAGIVGGASVLPPDEADASAAALTHIFTHKE